MKTSVPKGICFFELDNISGNGSTTLAFYPTLSRIKTFVVVDLLRFILGRARKRFIRGPNEARKVRTKQIFLEGSLFIPVSSKGKQTIKNK